MTVIISDLWKIVKYFFSKFISAVLASVFSLILWWPFSKESADVIGITTILEYRWVVGFFFLVFAVASLYQIVIWCVNAIKHLLASAKRRRMYKGKDAITRIESLSTKAQKAVRTKYERPYDDCKFSKTDPLLSELMQGYFVQTGRFSDERGYFVCELSKWVVTCLDSNPELVGSLPEPDEDLTF